ncbi:hypothetical protein LZ496_01965 [Sphingomonas sp. NSE70-1]|uniref:Phytoene synthase n=1 Tax=Sphingomonas caseinilyticus TaxID=2908205 RepID=A0ABT0RRL1_9SPHN|nr:hypothetical protein [Sphingomonas caseinilyticus]MCL6697551.1 hypothetical protein [Sphingomonas caseinilyticus]
MTSSTQPALGAIRLAWWREALERLDNGSPPPEPRLQAVVSQLIPRGISGKALAAIEDGWATLLDESPDRDRIAKRGELIFEIAARLLGESDSKLAPAGRLFALQQVARKHLRPSIHADSELPGLAGHRFARKLRPLTAFARLAVRDVKQFPEIEPEATPARAVALLSHRLFGTIG